MLRHIKYHTESIRIVYETKSLIRSREVIVPTPAMVFRTTNKETGDKVFINVFQYPSIPSRSEFLSSSSSSSSTTTTTTTTAVVDASLHLFLVGAQHKNEEGVEV